jgi:hypothetical protein
MNFAALDPALAVDAIIVLMLLELAVLLAWRRRAFAECAATLLSGLALLLALRLVLDSAPIGWVLPCLALAGAAHVVDLWRRLGRRSTGRRMPGRLQG